MENLEKVFKDKRVLVTGHTGFKGSWLTLWLVRLGAKVIGLSDDVPTTPSNFEVNNIEGLYICDASVFSSYAASNIHSSVVLLADIFSKKFIKNNLLNK